MIVPISSVNRPTENRSTTSRLGDSGIAGGGPAATISFKAPARASGFSGGTRRPHSARYISDTPPTAVARNGLPAAVASMRAMGVPS